MRNPEATVLIVDDEKNTREGLELALAASRYRILQASRAEEALAVLEKEGVDVLLTDLIMDGIDGLELMRRAKERDPELLVIMLTAYGSVETAVQAMKRGAFDYLTKPVNLDRLEILVKRALNSRRMEKENVQMHQQLSDRFGFENIVGHSKKMKDIFDTVRQVSASRAAVLIQGESGTGKELIARAIHYAGPQKDSPFIAVHCAALAEGVLESELFGHEKGAFTGALDRKRGRFELAHNGTLFLDEVGEMSPSTQVKLLRVLQEKTFERVGGNKTLHVDVRILTATNKDLREEVRKGTFREDLFYRINVVTVGMPPLRERMEDLPLLTSAFIKEFAAENKKIVEGISPEALQALHGHSWPGNVRELRNVLETMVVLTRNRILGAGDIPPAIRGEAGHGAIRTGRSLNVHDAEHELIVKALESANNNKSRAAQILGMSRRTLHRKLKVYGIQ